ncbi:LuxR C-terminal-related transcriptional regulator [Nucisporomicrobium flavum]|uniref:LuxR C-terminal-related transcriptional regulator n=1 Tax=Nucisporomicrobium flavum TaxID=2785915 RepID=UPI0018F4A591|nr:LuxR C-terminal-related transcriptional regulator [Nucisporomicrobium flavum]
MRQEWQRAPGDGRPPLDVAVGRLYSDQGLAHVLRHLLVTSSEVVPGIAGSVSLVDARSGTYSKVAEIGVPCKLGRSFPLDEGATGEAFARRRPVVLPSYERGSGRHLPPGHPASRGSAVAVPMWWRGEVIAVNIGFAGESRSYSAREIDALEVLSQAGAGAILRAGDAGQPLLARIIRERFTAEAELTGIATRVTEVGTARPLGEEVAQVATEVVTVAALAASRSEGVSRVHVAVVHRAEGLRLLVQDDSAPAGHTGPDPDPLGLGTTSWSQLLAAAGGAVTVDRVPGWGTVVRADVPYATGRPATAAPVTSLPSPLSAREKEVLTLLAQGRTDREVAAVLFLSPKTVEKHVGAALRKTRTTSRTGAVVRALENGWITRPAG